MSVRALILAAALTTAPIVAGSGLAAATSVGSAPAPRALSDVAELVAKIHRERDKVDPLLIQQLAEDGTRAGAEGLVSVYESMSSINMRLEVLLALALYDGVPEGAQIALQQIANIATTSEEPELHELALPSSIQVRQNSSRTESETHTDQPHITSFIPLC